ncbi:MAG TPA: MFS transporter [Mycobacteriales bacterium]|nr:MFS transporter [Mycobacteriales bacterium]
MSFSDRLRIGGLYLGGLLGPFGGAMTTSMLPELGSTYDVSVSATTASLTAYLVPLAVLMLVSGTIGERYGRGRTVMLGYAVYTAASIVCALASTYSVFLGARVLQGAANAFTTPLLLVALGSTVPVERLGRALGTFASVQAIGQSSSPLVGGLAAEVDWRWAFVGVAAVSAVLGTLGLPRPTAPAARVGGGGRLRSLWHREVGRLAIVAMAGWACLGGLNFLVAIRAEDVFGLSSAQRGLLLTGFGVVGLFGGRLVGRAVDRHGARRCGFVGGVGGGVLVALCAFWTPAAGLAAGWALCGVASQVLLVSLNSLSLNAVPENRGGAVGVVQAFRFGGGALAPAAWLPLYHLAPAAGFLAPGLVLAGVTGLAFGRRARPVQQPPVKTSAAPER